MKHGHAEYKIKKRFEIGFAETTITVNVNYTKKLFEYIYAGMPMYSGIPDCRYFDWISKGGGLVLTGAFEWAYNGSSANSGRTMGQF